MLVAGGLVVVGLVVALAVYGYLGALFGRSGDPECSELPDRQTAQRAIDAHPELVRQLSGAVPGVQVTISTPCADPGAALVVVRVTQPAEQPVAEELLAGGEGFGVPTVVQTGESG